VLHLRDVLFEHFLPLSDGAETCQAMQDEAKARNISAVPCFFSHALNNHSGWAKWGTKPGCVSAARANHYCAIEQLWATRCYVAGHLLTTGINVLYLDTDSIILSDPYAILKTPPYDAVNLVLLAEQPVNGGLWYAQNTAAGAGAQWVLAEVARRTAATISLPLLSRMLVPYDQAFLGDALLTAGAGGTPIRDAACRHPALTKLDLCEGQYRRYPLAMAWHHTTRLRPPTAAAAASLLPVLPNRAMVPNVMACIDRCSSVRCRDSCLPPPGFDWNCASGGECRDWPLRSAELRVRGEPRVEVAALGAPWLFAKAWKAQQAGSFGRQPAAITVAHLLGVRCRWCLSSLDLDHGSKWEWQHLAGFYSGRAYNLALPLATPPLAGPLPDITQLPGRGAKSRLGGISSTFAERTQANCRWRGRAALLYADRRTLSLAPSAPQLLEAEAADDGGAAARTLVRRLVSLAAVTGRMAVLPSFNCSAPWIQKQYVADGAIVVTDLRVVVVDISAGRSVGASRCAPCNVQFGCRMHVLSEAQHQEARRVRGAGAGVLPQFGVSTAMNAGATRRLREQHQEARRVRGAGAGAGARDGVGVHDDASVGAARRLRADAGSSTAGGGPSHPDAVMQLQLPLRQASGWSSSPSVIDLAALWSLLLVSPPYGVEGSLLSATENLHSATGGLPSTAPLSTFTRLGTATELVVTDLSDVVGDACSLDLQMLYHARRLASDVVQIHCGVESASYAPGRPCPWNAAEVEEALGEWERRARTQCVAGGERRSPLAARLSFRCTDMLCSEESCAQSAVTACTARLSSVLGQVRNDTAGQAAAAGRSRAGHKARGPPVWTLADLRARCSFWVESLPNSVQRPGALCDGLSGVCRTPPEMHPGRALWPVAECMRTPMEKGMCLRPAENGNEEEAAGLGKDRRRRSAPARNTTECGACWRK
jgi:hypothetical protein